MSSPYEKTDFRYRNDATFHQLVDMMTRFIETLHLTPGEMREAAMLASLRFEERQTDYSNWNWQKVDFSKYPPTLAEEIFE